MYLDPAAEEAYMDAQVEIARRTLAESPRRPGAPDLTEAELGRAFERVYAEAVAEAGLGHTVTPATQLEQAGRATGRDPSTTQYLRELESAVREAPFQRAPGALELLSALREDGYGVGVISNTVGEPGRFLRPMLHALGFDRYVQSYVFSDEHPWTKPAPEIFHAALRDLGAQPEDAVHVGDGWSDIEGARRARFRAGILFTGLHSYGARYQALFLPAGWNQPPAEYEVGRLEEVLRLVRRLLPSQPAR